MQMPMESLQQHTLWFEYVAMQYNTIVNGTPDTIRIKLEFIKLIKKSKMPS